MVPIMHDHRAKLLWSQLMFAFCFIFYCVGTLAYIRIWGSCLLKSSLPKLELLFITGLGLELI